MTLPADAYDDRDPRLVALAEGGDSFYTPGHPGYDDEGTPLDYSITDTIGAFTNELVKSYGLRRDNSTGEWSWSLDNIGESFKEDPVWTTLDYLLVGVPISKWGSAAYKVSSASKGAGLAKRGYAAGSFAGQTAETRVGRFIGRQAGDDAFGAAVEFERQFGVPHTKVGRAFSSGVARVIDPDWQRLTDEVGMDPWELRGLHEIFRREATMAGEGFLRRGQMLVKEQNRALGTAADSARRREFVGALQTNMDVDDVIRVMGEDAGNVYRKTWQLRYDIHERAHDLGMISDEVYEANLNTYWPRQYREWLDVKPTGGPASTRGGNTNAFRHTRWDEDTRQAILGEGIFHQINDPALGTMKIAEAGVKVAQQAYLQRMAQSAVVKSADEIIEHMEDLWRPAARWGRAGDLGPEALDTGDAIVDQFRRVSRGAVPEENVKAAFARLETVRLSGAEVSEELIRRTVQETFGWQPLDDVFARAGIPEYLSRLPEEMRGKFVDPAVAGDIIGMAKYSEQLPEFVRGIYDWYRGTLAGFKVGKTAYNPATHFRNIFGAMIFHNLTVGMGDSIKSASTFYSRGRKALEEGIDNADFRAALDAGLIGSSHQREFYETMSKLAGIDDVSTVSEMMLKIPVIGQSFIMKGVSKAAARMEEFYRWTDEVAKVDAFLIRRDARIAEFTRSGRHGTSAQEIAEAATRSAYSDVAKFQPMFSQNSPVTNMVREAIPFASFTTEAVRIWKNALIEKPHVAFFWNNFAEATGQLLGGAAGFHPDELEAAKAALPDYMKGKKMLIWPLKVDGKPAFLDMSYMIPMANLSEAVAAESTLFDMVQVDPFTNPLASMAAAVSLGVDPFSKREIQPNFTERQLGVEIDNPALRRVVGLAEHAAKLILPPLVPPGYAGVNLLEWARGQRHPISGQELEKGAMNTIGANILGVRLYEADVNAQVLNVKRGEKEANSRMASNWARWRWGAANGDPALMQKSLDNIKELRRQRGDDDAAVNKYIESAIKRREIGKFRGVSTRHLEEILDRSRKLGYKNEDDRAMLAELTARYQERTARGR